MDAKLYCNLARSIKTARNAVIRVSCITEEDLNQLGCQPIPHATTYQSSTHDFDLPHFQPTTNHPPSIST
ncbi:hypothetical protein V1478_000023 [Vespula squamosa]|uniref:Uncharacterized protein n=1 Tax=Vespula squamosa TaxID=30214 RepID=A0ABD2C987_VESSQ